MRTKPVTSQGPDVLPRRSRSTGKMLALTFAVGLVVGGYVMRRRIGPYRHLLFLRDGHSHVNGDGPVERQLDAFESLGAESIPASGHRVRPWREVGEPIETNIV